MSYLQSKTIEKICYLWYIYTLLVQELVMIMIVNCLSSVSSYVIGLEIKSYRLENIYILSLVNIKVNGLLLGCKVIKGFSKFAVFSGKFGFLA